MRKTAVILFAVLCMLTVLGIVVSSLYLYTHANITAPDPNRAICRNSLLGKLKFPELSAANSTINMTEARLGLSQGGRFSPTNCKSEYKVAIIIPLRNRESQLRTLLSHMHPIWKRQLIAYRVYVINQIDGALFNRGKLLNVGVSEASKDEKHWRIANSFRVALRGRDRKYKCTPNYTLNMSHSMIRCPLNSNLHQVGTTTCILDDEYDCFVFHDVDLLLENDKCMYSCDTEHPRHLAMYMNKFGYKKLGYSIQCSFNGKDLRNNHVMYFGGVSMVTNTQFLVSNGYSNIYWGWGAEDDDFYIRLKNTNYSVANPYGRNCSYSMIKHKRDVGNPPNPARFYALRKAHQRRTEDGYNSVKYQVISRELMLLYTNVTVDIGKPSQELQNFMRDCQVKTCPVNIPLE